MILTKHKKMILILRFFINEIIFTYRTLIYMHTCIHNLADGYDSTDKIKIFHLGNVIISLTINYLN